MDSSDPDSPNRHPDDYTATLNAQAKIIRQLEGSRVAAEGQAEAMREIAASVRAMDARVDASCAHCAAQGQRMERAITVHEQLSRDPRWMRFGRWVIERYIEHTIKLTVMSLLALAFFALALWGGLDLSGLWG